MNPPLVLVFGRLFVRFVLFYALCCLNRQREPEGTVSGPQGLMGVPHYGVGPSRRELAAMRSLPTSPMRNKVYNVEQRFLSPSRRSELLKTCRYI